MSSEAADDDAMSILRAAAWVVLFGCVACGEDSGPGAGAGASGGVGGNVGGAPSGGAAGTGGTSGASGGGAGGNPSGGTAGAAGSSGGASGGGAGAGGSSGSDAGDAGDAGGVPLPGFGAISGDCGPIDATEILSPNPYSFDTNIDFGTLTFDTNALSVGGKKIWDAGNLGGSSIHSEIFSYEVLYRCELATLLKTEGEVAYTDTGGKKTDLLVEIDGYKVGVSVTRAFIYPPGTPYTQSAAQALLEKKLGDILLSTQNVKPEDAWKKQILHVLAYDKQHRDALAQAYPLVAPATRADTIVMVTITDGNDAFMY